MRREEGAGAMLRERSRNRYDLPVRRVDVAAASDESEGHVVYRDADGVWDESRAWDFAAPVGRPVLAAAPGVVREVVDGAGRSWHEDAAPPRSFSLDDLNGNVAVVVHARGERSVYCHLETGSFRVRAGDRVASGDVLAAVGMTGWTTAPHLHFAVVRDRRDGPGFESLQVRWRAPRRGWTLRPCVPPSPPPA